MNDEASPSVNGHWTAVVEDVRKEFRTGSGDVKAVDGVSFRLPAGKVVALRGPSGCGKSTLLNLLGALDRPTSGRLTVDGTDLAKLRGGDEVAYRRRKVGFVFQMFNLMPNLSAVENVALPMELAGTAPGKARDRAAQLLDRVGIPADRHSRRPARLSGGEQQRVAIARALANDPPLILADEPTANLDSTTGARIVQLLRSLADENRTVVIATHDDSIAGIADVVIGMRDGRIAVQS
ncbi:MAG TPA: ABC transporter ATP-binding protein [Dehalococcoidia bacterium]|nr:ABC transporter ATP-binding protein [Dehalococcoidia bacterium]